MSISNHELRRSVWRLTITNLQQVIFIASAWGFILAGWVPVDHLAIMAFLVTLSGITVILSIASLVSCLLCIKDSAVNPKTMRIPEIAIHEVRTITDMTNLSTSLFVVFAITWIAILVATVVVPMPT